MVCPDVGRGNEARGAVGPLGLELEEEVGPVGAPGVRVTCPGR